MTKVDKTKQRAHALLSASSAHRWLNCPPSALISDTIPETGDNLVAEEGTAAHALAEHKLRKHLKQRSTYPTSDFIDEEMQEHTDGYVAFVLDRFEQAKKRTPDARLLIEQKLDFSEYVPDGFGTGDCIIIDDDTLHVIDLKYGAGVLVKAEDNPQMKLYALGALAAFGFLYDVEKVEMTIYQPRRENICTAILSAGELVEWAEQVVKPAASVAADGEGEFSAGEWCLFCPIKATCRARAEKNLEIAQYEFAKPDQLSEAELADILTRLPELTKWAQDVEKYAHSLVVERGKTLPGFKIVAGRSRRVYTDTDRVAQVAQEAGYTDVFEKKLLTITAMEKYLGKKTFTELLGDLVTKPAGKPTLAPESDPRPALKPATSAIDDFS